MLINVDEVAEGYAGLHHKPTNLKNPGSMFPIFDLDLYI